MHSVHALPVLYLVHLPTKNHRHASRTPSAPFVLVLGNFSFVDSSCLVFMMRSIWSSIVSVFGFTSSKIIMISFKFSSSHTESFTSSAFVHPVLIFSFNLMILDNPFMSTAYIAPLFYSKAALLLLYVSTPWLQRRTFYFTSSSATIVYVGSGVIRILHMLQ